eukprot:182214-Prymnesium_polylepis.1
MHTTSRDSLETHSASLELAALHTALAAVISFESVFRSAYSSSSRARVAATLLTVFERNYADVDRAVPLKPPLLVVVSEDTNKICSVVF